MIFYALYQMGVMFKGGYVFNIFCHEFYTEGVQLLGYTVACASVGTSVVAGVVTSALSCWEASASSTTLARSTTANVSRPRKAWGTRSA